MIKNITKTELVEVVRAIKGAKFTSVTYFVDESKSKSIKGAKALQKLVTVNLTLNSDYERKVNRILENKQDETADFVAQAMKGKTLAFEGCRSILKSEKTEKLLLYGIIEHNAPKQTTYYKDGQPIAFEKAVEEGLFIPSFFAEKETSGRGAVESENDFFPISPAIDSIRQIRLDGQEYSII